MREKEGLKRQEFEKGRMEHYGVNDIRGIESSEKDTRRKGERREEKGQDI